MQRLHHPVPLGQILTVDPALGSMLERLRQAEELGRCIQPLIPPMLRKRIRFSVLRDGEWCLIVQGNAVAAKARQLLPLWLRRLQERGHAVERIRLHLEGSQR